ncbi:MAG: cyclophilin-like fold protein [Butyrivibrio sp.]|nr:cyclophilin-like fold protein [Butyrivibrio sp.]
MKRIFCLLLSLVFTCFPTACGRTDSYSETKSGSETSVQTEADEITSESETEETNYMLKIEIGDTVFTAALAENSTVDAFKELLADAPLVLNMHDYANMEKGADLGVTLPQNNEPMNTQAGDIILYQGRTFVIYYDTNSWSLTPIGKINDLDAEVLRAALGDGDVTVTVSLVRE